MSRLLLHCISRGSVSCHSNCVGGTLVMVSVTHGNHGKQGKDSCDFLYCHKTIYLKKNFEHCREDVGKRRSTLDLQFSVSTHASVLKCDLSISFFFVNFLNCFSTNTSFYLFKLAFGQREHFLLFCFITFIILYIYLLENCI